MCRTCYWAWYKKQPQNQEYQRNWQRNKTRELREAIFEKYGKRCRKCGFDDPRALQIDHVRGGGIKELSQIHRRAYHLKVLRDTKGLYQILCANCNWIKRYEAGEFDALGTGEAEGGLPEPLPTAEPTV